MPKTKRYGIAAVLMLSFALSPVSSSAWYDETHLAMAKAAGYEKWYHACGADMAKIKAGPVETGNHFAANPPGTAVSLEMVLDQVEKYNSIDERGHLYGAILASVREYFSQTRAGKYGAYHLGFCAHYLGDLSQPLHNTPKNPFNQRRHREIDGIINDEALMNLDEVRIYPIRIDSEMDLAREVARIANDSIALARRIEAQGRPLTKEEAYGRISESASLFKAVLDYVKRCQRQQVDGPRSTP